MTRADEWEAEADERERLADERERLADERDGLADQRERLADQHDYQLERREANELAYLSSVGALNGETELAALRAAERRAEAAVRRAEAELLRTRLTAMRIQAGIARRAAGNERADQSKQFTGTADQAERAWLVDRRDFVAADRERLSIERDRVADERDEVAAQRERLADVREREALERERQMDQRRATASRPSTVARPDGVTHRADSEPGDVLATDRPGVATDRRAGSARAPSGYGPMLLASFAELVQHLLGSEDLAEALPRVLRFTTEVVVGCDRAAVTLVSDGRTIGGASSDPAAAELNDIQFRTGAGPGPDALRRDEPVYLPDLPGASGSPDLAAAATRLGVGSSVCYGLFADRPVRWSAFGAFCLYSATPGGFSDEDLEVASILAAFLSVAVAIAQLRDDVERREAALHRALSTRDVIGQAKGILMERQRLSAGDAFDLLRRASQRLNRRLADVAQHLAETGELPA